MNKREFIIWLENYLADDTSIIQIFNPDAGNWCPITGLVYDPTRNPPTIRFYSDED